MDCIVEECANPRHARGMCRKHERRVRLYGDPHICKVITDDDPLRFWSKVDKRGDDECWEWTGARHVKGYGAFVLLKKCGYAHRASFFFEHGRHPELCVLHTCDNPPCVNPAHLYEGTYLQNAADKVARNRQLKGESHPNAKISDEHIVQLKELRKSGITYHDLASRFGIGREQARRICLGIQRSS